MGERCRGAPRGQGSNPWGRGAGVHWGNRVRILGPGQGRGERSAGVCWGGDRVRILKERSVGRNDSVSILVEPRMYTRGGGASERGTRG